MFDPHNPIRNPKLQDLSVAAIVGSHLVYMEESVVTQRYYEALLSSEFVRRWFTAHPEYNLDTTPLYDQLRTAMVDNAWVALRMNRQEAVAIDLFRNHLLELFTITQRYTFDFPTDQLVTDLLLEGTRGYLLNYMLFEERDQIKAHLCVALEKSETVLTSAQFFLDIKETTPTLSNWFQVYKTYMGSAIESEDRRRKFLNISENGARLTIEERKCLGLVFQLYYRLNLSSFTQLGMEEEITYTTPDESGIFLYGEQFPHDKDTVKTIRELVGTPTDTVASRPPVTTVSAKFDPNFEVTGPDVTATAGPDHFTDEDSLEIAQHSAQVSELGTQSKADYQKIANDIKSEVALSFDSPEDDKRFVDLVVSVLRGLRDTMELKQYLLDLSFPTAECDAVVATLEQHLGNRPKQKRATPVKDNLATKPTLQQLQKKLEQPTAATAMTQPQFGMQVEPPATASVERGRKAFLPKLRRSRAVKRPLVDDVRLQPSMVMGPIDELRAMDALEFRRLSPDPAQAARRMKDKIELLAEESITKQAEGIDAFKQSPINMLYLELGNESIASGKPVSTVIAERQATGTPTLSEAEFDAISDLNKQLRF